MSRLLIVSNRLPVTLHRDGDTIACRDSCGGLATGLRGHHERGNGLWIGWPGSLARLRRASDHDAEIDALLASRRLAPVHLTAQEARQYYEAFSNGVIWPLFHYLLDRMRTGDGDWQAYRDVNERFADRVAEHYRPDDVVWVHDYHLMLVPALLRQRIPDARIGFFLHIPFPSSELFRILPWRETLLEGLLGADLVGFHTHAYVRHFVVALRHILGLQPETDHVQWGDRIVRFNDFPMGIDDGAFEALAGDPAVQAETTALRQEAGGRAILLGVDRLDYTKGIPRRLLAFEQLLESDVELRDRVRLIQLAVPSRDGLAPYQAFRRQVEEIVGRINGRFGTTGSAPVHYLHRSLSRPQLVALYRAADVMLVTPVRDGMNLVAKEFVASRTDEGGVLILSEFAGAAAEMGEALLVNPYDEGAIAAAMRRALEMDAPERATRMRELRERVKRQNLHRWTATYLGALGVPGREDASRIRIWAPSEVAALAEQLRQADELVVLLDYDGTLVPFTAVPDLAHPDPELLELLRALAFSNRAVHVVSGRGHDTLERWLGDVPIDLWAEHGLWHRPNDSRRWDVDAAVPPDWFNQARTILEWFTARTPGSLIETKASALAWHYRMSDPEMGEEHARHLRRTLTAALHRHPVEILDGKKVVELRLRAASKQRVVNHILKRRAKTPVILAVGDDRTDEDMFAALPASGISIRVGPGPTRAQHRLPDSQAVRSLVRGLLQ
jgi:trehalose 6-phosphate synthase/phosphatase